MIRRMRVEAALREDCFLRHERKAAMRFYDAGDLAGLEVYCREVFARQIERADRAQSSAGSRWSRIEAYLA